MKINRSKKQFKNIRRQFIQHRCLQVTPKEMLWLNIKEQEDKKQLALQSLLLLKPDGNIKLSLTQKGMDSVDYIYQNLSLKPAVILHRNENFDVNETRNSNLSVRAPRNKTSKGKRTKKNKSNDNFDLSKSLKKISTQKFAELLVTASTIASMTLARSMHCCNSKAHQNASGVSQDATTNTENNENFEKPCISKQADNYLSNAAFENNMVLKNVNVNFPTEIIVDEIQTEAQEMQAETEEIVIPEIEECTTEKPDIGAAGDYNTERNNNASEEVKSNNSATTILDEENSSEEIMEHWMKYLDEN